MRELQSPDEIVDGLFGPDVPHQHIPPNVSSVELDMRKTTENIEKIRRAIAYSQVTGDVNLYDPETLAQVYCLYGPDAEEPVYITEGQAFPASLFEAPEP